MDNSFFNDYYTVPVSQAEDSKQLETLKEQNDKIKKTAEKLIADFDKLKEENLFLKEKIKKLQNNYLDTTNLNRQNIAYGKAFGAILGAIEACKKEL